MPRWSSEPHDNEGDFGEEIDEDWADHDDDESETVACPRCGADVYEDAAYCPHCDCDLTDAHARTPRRPLWIIGGTLLCMYIFYRWITLQ